MLRIIASVYLSILLFVALLQCSVVAEESSAIILSEEPQNDVDDRQLRESFRLKIYWQKGYFWQESKIEKKWCLTCRNGCKSGSNVQIKPCGNDNTYWTFDDGRIKVANADVCMTMIGGKEMALRGCSNDNDQKFHGLGGSKFELSPVSGGGCLAQEHHPRDKEVIYRHVACRGPRKNKTNWYVKY